MYGGVPYAGGPFAGSLMDVGDIPVDTETHTAIEVAFTTDALDPNPVWVDIAGDCRWWDTTRGRNRELERFQPGRATIELGNRERQYDSSNAGGPHDGNLRPMRRVRIRETFNGVTSHVWDGFVDKWLLDYPAVGHDATATIIATDAFKVFARDGLPRSVYALEVEADKPDLWWHLDEGIGKLAEGFALNAGAGGSTRDGSYLAAPAMGTQGLIVNDPGTSINIVSRNAERLAVLKQGVTLANAALPFFDSPTFSVEFWARMDAAGNTTGYIWHVGDGPSDRTDATLFYFDDDADGTGRFRFGVVAGGSAYGVETANDSVVPGVLHHVVCTVETSGQMVIYLDGVRNTTMVPGFTSGSLSGVTRTTGGVLDVGYSPLAGHSAAFNWHGALDEFAIYLEDIGQARVTAHHEAGTHPWQGDDADDRAGRMLDIAAYPDNLRELDDGAAIFQSATLDRNVLEHLQKTAESENGLLFMTGAGVVRLISRANRLGRLPLGVIFGGDQAAGEVGYVDVRFDDGDDTITNHATISRYNGVAKTTEDAASIAEFGRLDYTLEGLLHNSDALSLDYTEEIVARYKEPLRRVVGLKVGPPIVGQEAVVYPAMLGLELGDTVKVVNRPLGGGPPFNQVVAIEGIRASGRPGGVRTTEFVLSPGIDPSEFWILGVSELGTETILYF